MAINFKKIDKQSQIEIIEKVINGTSMRKIEQEYGVTRQSVSKYLKDNQINIKISGRRKYIHDFDYFENIDNEHKAYWLGFMFADGYIVDYSNNYGEDSFGIKLKKDDKQHLEKFKLDISATNPILDTSDDFVESCRIQCTSQKTVDDLISKGCVKRKSLILQPPKNVPSILIKDFIRGYFDGDGSLSYYITNKNYRNYQIKIVSTQEFCEWLLDFFKKGNIYQDKRTQKTWVYEAGGIYQVKTICDFLYKNTTIYLERKYNQYLEMLKYCESRGIN